MVQNINIENVFTSLKSVFNINFLISHNNLKSWSKKLHLQTRHPAHLRFSVEWHPPTYNPTGVHYTFQEDIRG